MTPALIDELIWHFAGYMHLPPPDLYSVKIIYEGGAPYAPAPPDTEHAPARAPWLSAANLTFGGMIFPLLPAPEDNHFHLFHLGPVLLAPDWMPPLQLAPPSPIDLPAQPPVELIGGGDFQLTISASYHGGGDQQLIDLQQINMLVNNNQVNAPADVVAWNDEHANRLITTLLDSALNHDQPNLMPQNAEDAGLQAYAQQIGDQPQAFHAQAAPFDVEPGQYVNGQLVTDGSDPHQITNTLLANATNALEQGVAGPPAPPTGDHAYDSIQSVSVGSNIAANDAAIANLETSSVSMAVLGNYYETEGVTQTNVFMQDDHFSGASAPSAISMAANSIENIADIQNQVPTLTSGGSGATVSGLTWNVEVLHGSMLNIDSLVQTNYIENNNVIYQTSSGGDSQIIAGSNVQMNGAESVLTSNYDLVIVEGNYYQDNLINQTNVVLDNNNVNFNGGAFSSQTGSGGGNNVVNDATIIDEANHTYQPLTANAQTVLSELENNSHSIDPSAALSAFPQLMGNINVLVVTGDVYDVNYVSQTNVMSNSNVVSLSGSESAPAGATQAVSTGNDTAVNAATIVDGGSVTSPYLQGNYYSDSILLQTNVIGDEAKIATQNPNQLAPELVAFTGALSDTSQSHHSDPISSALDSHHSDGMAAILG